MDSSSEPTPENTNAIIAQEINEEDHEEEIRTTASRGKRKGVPERNEARSSPQPLKPKKTLDTRSEVWSHFTRTAENRDKCNCNYCHKVFSCPTSSGTSNLQKHLTTCKHFKAWNDGQRQSHGKSQTLINESGGLSGATVSEEIFKEATNEMLVIGELPLSFIESMAWKHFCGKLHLYTPHSRRTATRNIVEMYMARKRSLRELFIANKQRVSLTTDIWVAQTTGASYMVITLHFIDAYWRLKKFIIGFKYITDHKGVVGLTLV